MPKLTFAETTLTVERETGDPKFHGAYMARGESQFLHWLKGILNREYGYDLVKVRMWKDGHLVDEMQQYLRTRSSKPKGPQVAIYNGHWAICGLDEDFNHGKAILSVVGW